METLFKLWTGYLASGVEGIAGILIAIAALQATFRAMLLKQVFSWERDRQRLRLQERA
ncbi:MAG: hypothetical protein H0U76_01275 [Ktedonobacteraceae bacterium]|nr:hypothetical protein [Ktedonobacteraceae bacterium]